jgi:hypothetical protein
MAFNMDYAHDFAHTITNPPINAIPKHAIGNITTAQVTNNPINNRGQEANTNINAG